MHAKLTVSSDKHSNRKSKSQLTLSIKRVVLIYNLIRSKINI